jgi:hypothetical protein
MVYMLAFSAFSLESVWESDINSHPKMHLIPGHLWSSST